METRHKDQGVHFRPQETGGYYKNTGKDNIIKGPDWKEGWGYPVSRREQKSSRVSRILTRTVTVTAALGVI